MIPTELIQLLEHKKCKKWVKNGTKMSEIYELEHYISIS